MTGFVSDLKSLRPLVLPVVLAGSEAEALLATLRRSYTMQRERDIHDSFTMQAGAGAPAPKMAETAAPAADDLDDILF
jgi:hypothetical protein